MASVRRDRDGNLRIDRILASEPELGPSVPDGGYGWLVLGASLFIKAILGSMISSYGIINLFVREELNVYEGLPRVWETPVLAAPVAFAGAAALLQPFARRLVSAGRWPRLCALCGHHVACAGVLLQWFALAHLHHSYLLLVISGALSGAGVCLTLTQCEMLLSQYFRRRRALVSRAMAAAEAFGLLVTPALLGVMMLREGVLRAVLIYAAIVLQLALFILLFHKPAYLKTASRRYRLLHNILAEDDTVYPSTEMTTTGPNNMQMASGVTKQQASSDKPPSATQPNLLQQSFAEEFSQDLGAPRQELASDPQPLFAAPHNEQTAVFDEEAPANSASWKDKWVFVCSPQFHSGWLLELATRSSSLIFWACFPAYVYVEMSEWKLRATAVFSGLMSLGSLVGVGAVALVVFVSPGFERQASSAKRHAYTALCCAYASLGHYVVGASGLEGWLLFGGLLVCLAGAVLGLLHPVCSEARLHPRHASYRAHILHSVIVSLALTVPLCITDANYRRLFKTVSLLHFVVASIYISTYLYNKIKQTFFTKFSSIVT